LEKRYKGETKRGVVQIRREKEPEYRKDESKKRIKIRRDKEYVQGTGRNEERTWERQADRGGCS